MSNFMNSSKKLPVEAATGALVGVWAVVVVAIQCGVRTKECCLTCHPSDRNDVHIAWGRFQQEPETAGDIAATPLRTCVWPIQPMKESWSNQLEARIPKLVHPLFVATGKYRPFSI